jgi:hypothetical protein
VAAPNLPTFNFRITDELNLGQSSETQKFNDNITAITALKTIERENRCTRRTAPACALCRGVASRTPSATPKAKLSLPV